MVDFVLQSGIDKVFRTENLRKRQDTQFYMDDIALTWNASFPSRTSRG
jgi:hypothetical protein